MSSAGLLRADWPAPAGTQALTTLRHAPGGASPAPFDSFNLGNGSGADGDDPANVERHREQLQRIAALPSRPHWLRQVHGTDVVRFDAPAEYLRDGAGDVIREAPRTADAAVTSAPGVVLAILSADCLPVLFCADDGTEVGAAHAGWRGLAAGVLEATVAAMTTPATRLLAWLGPAAGPTAYEVGDEVREAFVARDPHATSAFAPTRAGHWHCDLYRLARRRLADHGVERVYGGGRCTISEPEAFFSHRRDGLSGRIASLIWRDR